MSWPQTEMNSWANFSDFAERVGTAGAGGPAYCFRGQIVADWPLKPSLTRLLQAPGVTVAEAVWIEKNAGNVFQTQAHLHLPQAWLPPELPVPRSVDWWALMQHFSAPTRLLDWTHSIYVAAYFAVNADWEKDGAIYVLHKHFLNTAMQMQFGPKSYPFPNEDFEVDPPLDSRVVITAPSRRMDRIVAQQGIFTVSLNVLADHGELIEKALMFQESKGASAARDCYQRIIIPAKLKPEFMLHLRQMNIAAHSLFPGADGLGKSVADLIRVHRVFAAATSAPATPEPPETL